MNKKIVFTGGHHNSAIVVARLLAQRGFDIIWFGQKFSAKNDNNLSQEYQDLQKSNFRFIDLKSGKIYRGGIFEYFKLIKAYLFCFQKLTKIKPITISQANRISGVSPSDISVLLVYMGR